MHAKMEVNFFVMQITHVSEPNGAQSKKQKIKFRQSCLLMWSQINKKNALLAVNVGYFN